MPTPPEWTDRAREILERERQRLPLGKTITDVPPRGTRLILADEGFIEHFASRTDDGYRITGEWGEPDENGWYSPIFTVHADDRLQAEAAIRYAIGYQVHGANVPKDCGSCDDQFKKAMLAWGVQ